MSARTIESWEIDDWLRSLGFNPDWDACLAQAVVTWEVWVRKPTGEDCDEYLYRMEEAWREHFGPFNPVMFGVYKSPNEETLVDAGGMWKGWKVPLKTLPLSQQIVVDQRLARAAEMQQEQPKHLMHAKGPRNKWGGAKGVR